MYKILGFAVLLCCLLLPACKQTESTQNIKEDNTAKKTDLSKAASYNVQLGLGYLKQNDRPRAKKKLLLAMEQAPHSPEINASFAYFFEKTGEFDQAKKYYLKAISLSGNSGSQLNNYGAFLCRRGDYKTAEVYFLKAVKDVNYLNTSAAYENAGLCSLEIPDFEKAKTYFSSALDQDPTRRESLLELVKLEGKAGNDAQALKILDKYPEIVLNDRDLLDKAKELAIKLGEQNLVAKYETSFRSLESNIVTSGANNEYNNHTG
ncbi:MAG: type IV pilus biogenesis/stability protein PilW [Legionella sp.]